MDNQSPFDPNQTQPQDADRTQPVFQPRSNPVQPRSFAAPPIPPRPTFSPPPGYQPLITPTAPQPQILPQPVVPGQTPLYPPTTQFQVPSPATYPSPRAKPAKKHNFWWLLGGLFTTAVLVVAVMFVIRALEAQPLKAPQKVSDQFISDLQKDNSLDAYSLTSTSYQKANSNDYFQKIVNKVSSGMQGPVSVTDRKITKTSPPQAAVVYKIPTQYTTQYIKVTLEDTGTWQVTSFAASTTKPELTATR